MSRGEDQRSGNAADAIVVVSGDKDPRATAAGMDLHEQRMFIGERIRELVDKGFDREVLLQMMIGGLAFLADNFGVSREKIARALVQIQIHEDRGSMILDPKRES